LALENEEFDDVADSGEYAEGDAGNFPANDGQVDEVTDEEDDEEVSEVEYDGEEEGIFAGLDFHGVVDKTGDGDEGNNAEGDEVVDDAVVSEDEADGIAGGGVLITVSVDAVIIFPVDDDPIISVYVVLVFPVNNDFSSGGDSSFPIIKIFIFSIKIRNIFQILKNLFKFAFLIQVSNTLLNKSKIKYNTYHTRSQRDILHYFPIIT
jgi:hypothetical protein